MTGGLLWLLGWIGEKIASTSASRIITMLLGKAAALLPGKKPLGDGFHLVPAGSREQLRYILQHLNSHLEDGAKRQLKSVLPLWQARPESYLMLCREAFGGSTAHAGSIILHAVDDALGEKLRNGTATAAAIGAANLVRAPAQHLYLSLAHVDDLGHAQFLLRELLVVIGRHGKPGCYVMTRPTTQRVLDECIQLGFVRAGTLKGIPTLRTVCWGQFTANSPLARKYRKATGNMLPAPPR